MAFRSVIRACSLTDLVRDPQEAPPNNQCWANATGLQQHWPALVLCRAYVAAADQGSAASSEGLKYLAAVGMSLQGSPSRIVILGGSQPVEENNRDHDRNGAMGCIDGGRTFINIGQRWAEYMLCREHVMSNCAGHGGHAVGRWPSGFFYGPLKDGFTGNSHLSPQTAAQNLCSAFFSFTVPKWDVSQWPMAWSSDFWPFHCDVRIRRLKSNPAMKEIIIYTGCRSII